MSFGIERIDHLGVALSQALDGERVEEPEFARLNDNKGKIGKILNEASILLAEAISEESLLQNAALPEALQRIKAPTEALLQKYKSQKKIFSQITQFQTFVDDIEKLSKDSKGIEATEKKISKKRAHVLEEDIKQLAKDNPTLAKCLVRSLSRAHRDEIHQLWKKTKY